MTKPITEADFDFQLADYEFSRRVQHSIDAAVARGNVEDFRGAIRTIIHRYGWNPAKYPQHTSYTFWAGITGDYWGQFKKAMKRESEGGEIVDPTDNNVVKYHC